MAVSFFLVSDSSFPRQNENVPKCYKFTAGPEVHRCHLLIVSSEIPIGIVAICASSYFHMFIRCATDTPIVLFST